MATTLFTTLTKSNRNVSNLIPIKNINIFFVIATIASGLYAFSGSYNGDFIGKTVILPDFLITIVIFVTIIPQIYIWVLYKNRKKKEGKVIYYSGNMILFILMFMFIYNILVKLIFGVGLSDAPVYEAPFYIKPLIQIMNRIPFNSVGIFFIFINKKAKYDFYVSLMIVALSLLSHSIGSLFFLFLIFYFKYYQIINFFIKKNVLLAISLIFFVFLFVPVFYTIRDRLRGYESDAISTTDYFFGKFMGRLSSFSNNAVIIQEPVYFINVANFELDYFYYQIQIFKSIFGGDYRGRNPEFHIKGVYNLDDNLNSGYMTGIVGNLVIALYKSPLIFILNFFNLLILIRLIFSLSAWLKIEYSAELGFFSVLYPTISGVPTEFASAILSLIILKIMLYISYGFKKTTFTCNS